MSRRGMLIDVTKCVGCGECVAACQRQNRQPAHAAEHFDERTFTFVMDRGQDVYVRRLCMHCEQPSCASVCPVGALRKTPAGPVTYDPARCMGCRYCLMACPYGVPAYEWRSAKPRVRKCEMCAGRPGGPACAEACPEHATVHGERTALVAEARRRIAAEPNKYYPHIYGLKEAGGAGVLYIGPKSPAALGLPVGVLERPLPELTWQALRHVPDVVLFGATLLGGVYWITSRREKVQRAENGVPADRDGRRRPGCSKE